MMKFFLGVAFFLCGGIAHAQLMVDRIIIDFTPDKAPREDVRLQNSSSTETLYINVDVIEVRNPGEDNELRQVAVNPMEVGLLASPNRLILPPGGQQFVRLVSLLPAEENDRIYRVDFSPVVGELEATESAVRMMVAYEALVIVRPDSMNKEIEAERIENTVKFRNEGNTNVFVDRIEYCQPSDDLDEDDCEYIVGNRLYSGNTWEVELPGDGDVIFDLFDGRRTTTRQM